MDDTTLWHFAQGNSLLRILILMSDTGGGHRSAAQAIAAALRQQEHDAQVSIVDYLTLSGFPLALLVPGYSVVIHHPALWRLLWHASDTPAFTSLLAGAAGVLVRRAIRLAVEQAVPDVVVSVHPLATASLTAVLRGGAARIPAVVVVTDMVTIHPAWAAPQADAVVVATTEARDSMVSYGVPADRVSVLGLPVDARFALGGGGKAGIRMQLGLEAERFTVLLVGGGEGAGGLEEQAVAIVRRLAGRDAQLLVAAGRNERLRERLARCRWELPVRVLGFAQNMPDLMSAADLLVTKAGPGTISEALACGLPMIITSALPGQESGNVGYVVSHGAGYQISDSEELAQAVERLGRPEARDELAALSVAARKLARPAAASDIASLILGLARQ